MSHRISSCLVIACLCGALALALGTGPALAQYSPAKTPEGIQHMALITNANAVLYAGPGGDTGNPVAFFEYLFILEGQAPGGTRVPVSSSPLRSQPDGWLEAGDFQQIGGLQFVGPTPQTGRELLSVFESRECASDFGRTGSAQRCEAIGSEPAVAGHPGDYRLLVPALEKRDGVFKGRFVRVAQDGTQLTPAPTTTATAGGDESPDATAPARIGYDLILVVDSTMSMRKWFQPTTEVLEEFVQHLRAQMSQGEVDVPFNVGLLFYRDRKGDTDCDLQYLTRWGVELGANVDEVLAELSQASEASCHSDEHNEAVLDALNRVYTDAAWSETYKVVLLIGDAPPHGADNDKKNPMGFTVDEMKTQAEADGVRVLSFKIGTEDTQAFESLAVGTEDYVRGRFRAIETGDVGMFKRNLAAAMREEWDIVTKHIGVARDHLTRDDFKTGGSSLASKYGISMHEYPIIVARLPATSGTVAAPTVVDGWAPETIAGKAALREFLFLSEGRLKVLINTLDNLLITTKEADNDAKLFLETVRNSLASQVGLQPPQIFKQGETLSHTLMRAGVLPFETHILSFTPEEINTWKKRDWERLRTILDEKVTHLREFSQSMTNIRTFGDVNAYFVPRALFL